MTADHSYFDVLCALAASGQLGKEELAELSEHAARCVLCNDRMVEFRRIGIQLFFVRALKNSGERLPKGMQQRFVARAIHEGVPLRSPSRGVGFRALGSVTVLLMALLLVASLNDGSVRRSASETGLADTMRGPVLLDKGGIPDHAVAVRRVLRRSSESSSSLNSAALRPPQVTPLFAPKLTFATNSEIIRENAPHLLAECEQCTFVPLSFQSRFVFHGSLNPDTLRPGLKPDFKADVSRLLWNVVPQ